MKSRLCYLSKQDALIFLRHSFAIPKFLYILRTAPCFTSLCLEAYDSVLQSTLSEDLNIHFHDISAWIQATLVPVNAGGIGIRRAVQLALSAFLASAAGTHSIIYDILAEGMATIPYPAVEEAKLAWNGNLTLTSPVPPSDTKQKAWDMPLVQATYDHLLENASDTKCHA